MIDLYIEGNKTFKQSVFTHVACSYGNIKTKERFYIKRVQLPQDWFWTQTSLHKRAN